jgi:hypothetical protein
MPLDTPGTVRDGIELDLQNSLDQCIAAYMSGIDATLIREQLKLTPDERFRKHQSFMKLYHELKAAGARARGGN